jgi:iron(III) transport system substrate-binding protein
VKLSLPLGLVPRLAARRIFAIAVTALCTAGLLAACGSSSDGSGSSASSGSSKGSITLYSGQHEQTTQSLVAAFEKKTGITVNVRYNDEDTFADEVVAEEAHPKADVFYTENSPALEYLQNKGLLAPVDLSTLAQTATKYNSAQGDWVGISARVSVLIYNPSLIRESQLPTTVLGLASPEYKGKLAFAAGETDFQPIVTSVDRSYGQAATVKWLDGIKSNAGSHVYPDNETIADEVNRGEVAFGVVNQYYWYRMKEELGTSNIRSQISYFARSDPGYVLDVSGAAVLKSSKKPAAAQEFLAFLVSKAGQEIIAHSISYEYPLDHGVQTTAPETPFDQLQPNPITIAELGDGSTAISLLQQAGML